MQKIYKYPLPITDEFVIEMPAMHRLLLVDTQKGMPFVWALVNPDTEKILVTFRIYGTGHGIKDVDKMQYVGTFQEDFGNLVWHVFKVLDA